jgi:phosphatidylglycerophosphatase A
MLGIGYIPIAPATVASAVLALLFYFLGVPSYTAFVIILPLLFFLGVYISNLAEEEWGSDSGRIVIDECAGFLVSIAFISSFYGENVAGNLILAFFLFRFFDIVKPFPIDRSQSLPGGWGVMTDDLLAGIYTNIMIRIFNWLFWN